MRSGRTIGALILREMGSTYGRSPGGYVWALLEPIGMILLLSVAFSLLLRSPSLGTSFLLFYATGFLPFQIYQKLESKVNSALTYSKSLLAYPRVTWLDAILSRAILNFLTMAMVFFIVITGVLLTIDSRTIIDVVPIVTALVMMALLGFGAGLMNGVLKGLFPVWKQIWSIASRPLFIASGLFFVYEDLPPIAQDVLWWNPLFHGTGLTRTGFYPTYDASYVSLPYCFGFGLVLTALGLLLMRSHYKRVLEN
jgi:capsular polysaccharide transport system permease protein